MRGTPKSADYLARKTPAEEMHYWDGDEIEMRLGELVRQTPDGESP